MERQEIEERLAERIVLNELRLLDQHLQTRGNGADIHVRSRYIRANLIAYKQVITLEHNKDITFEKFKEEYDEEYLDLIEHIKNSVNNFHYKV